MKVYTSALCVQCVKVFIVFVYECWLVLTFVAFRFGQGGQIIGRHKHSRSHSHRHRQFGWHWDERCGVRMRTSCTVCMVVAGGGRGRCASALWCGRTRGGGRRGGRRGRRRRSMQRGLAYSCRYVSECECTAQRKRGGRRVGEYPPLIEPEPELPRTAAALAMAALAACTAASGAPTPSASPPPPSYPSISPSSSEPMNMYVLLQSVINK